VTALLYPAASLRARAIRLPVFVAHDDDRWATGWTGDVHLTPWFPHGTSFARACTFPGTSSELGNDYTIVTAPQTPRAPKNQAIEACMHINFRGNVLVLRHAKHHPMTVTNLHSSERTLVQHIVQQYVDLFLVQEFSNMLHSALSGRVGRMRRPPS
ncbi:hypothetical protein K466DRAFT_507643, partial [Polyporus arcularius HHB13444]